MRSKKGTVVGNKLGKTVIIEVFSYKSHPKYKKRYKVSKKFYAHNPDDTKYELGQELTVYECRPMSRLKRWTVVNPKTSK